jgi:D-3-phosphoglycerate dehydrogenase / 2-oxoglutarate reductase
VESNEEVLRKTVLIIDEMHPSIFPMLEGIGVIADYRPDIKPIDVCDALSGMDGLIVRSKMRVTADTLRYADKLKFVARAGAGVDNIDAVALQQKGITLIAANEGNRQAVGEFTLGILLSLLRNITRGDRQVKEQVWLREENRGEELSEKTVGIIGFGNMGQSFARVLQGFGCRIIAYDKFAPEKIAYPYECVSLEVLKEEADVVSLHIPYIHENLGFVDSKFFEGFQKQIWFLNTSRGDVVEQSAVIEHLQTGKLKGVALDVLENEKLHSLTTQQKEEFDFLVRADNVVLTPHIAGWTHESYVKINKVLIEKIKDLI